MRTEKITKEFKAKKHYRIILSLIAMLFCMALLKDGYMYLLNGKSSSSVQVNLILIGCTLVLVFFALKSIVSTYRITDEELTVRSFLKKDRCYPISQIEVVELISERFAIIQLHFSDGKKAILEPIDNENEFIEILKEKLRITGKPWTFIKK